MMAEIVFLALCVAGAFALAMRRAPLWAWSAGLAGATFIWQTGLLRGEFGNLEPGLLGLLMWAVVIALAGLCIPTLRRRGPVALIGLSSAVPTPPFMATGTLGRAQLEAL